MRASTLLSLPVLAASAVSAQTTIETGPFLLKIANSANETLNDQYLYSCHAGAGIEGLCLSPTINSSFTLNTTDSFPYGPLIWQLPVILNGTDQEVPSAVSLQYNPGSNVAVALFYTGTNSNIEVRFDDDDRLVVYSSFDDSKAVEGGNTPPPDSVGQVDLSHWYACWTIVGGYYYQALTWVTTGEPHNPTCQAVDVVKTDV